ncbi:hypothetical protein CAPTEDRAFT_188303 [Capitella teleta]|uniref:Uncharacterized protein n=1 Tax=Capitella teleta TaxID=283909 RepID=R7TVI8_CAPTE|nr:hypothetical protein CAPTEDRAFT_188303 [Capitella teleta]|eukprot:ELT97893.1 hypothetical protein CAPTEDRAFT_188303 [Capitella teleta]
MDYPWDTLLLWTLTTLSFVQPDSGICQVYSYNVQSVTSVETRGRLREKHLFVCCENSEPSCKGLSYQKESSRQHANAGQAFAPHAAEPKPPKWNFANCQIVGRILVLGKRDLMQEGGFGPVAIGPGLGRSGICPAIHVSTLLIESGHCACALIALGPNVEDVSCHADK